ncbi:hypothetical protein SLEP1_g7946 [Rubroshorea leprosula]|uniref:40S ribosomal protein S21 n=1 Tax=Rubroshorea leprosula TaxID=152421 RepID=A0AAV5IB09_9ROSI|nr:hypothetical protein SLEP1_g7946 [Rubroshorea leprosula]
MQNKEGQNMDLYIPRKCSATNRLITSKDHALTSCPFFIPWMEFALVAVR